MHSSTHPLAHHATSGRRFSPRSSPALFWDSDYMGNPSSIYLDPDGEVITSSDPIAAGAPAPDKAAPPDILPGVGIPPQGSSSAIPTDASKDAQASSAMQTSTVVTPTTATVEGTSAQSSNTSSAPSPSSDVNIAEPTTTASAVSSGSAATETSSVVSTAPPSSAVAPSSTSSGPPAGASPTSLKAAASADTADRRTSVYVGLAFAAIAGVGLVIAVLAWWLRIRSRTRRRKLSTTTAWPWDHDRLGGRQLSLEGGLGIHGYHGDMVQRSPSLFGGEGGPGFPTGHIPRDAFPLPPAPVHTAQMGSPYVTIPLHGAHQSVPDLAPDLGTLQITNLVPGDLSHGSDSSRASTALGMQHTLPAEYGTPFLPHRPCFLGVENGGLEVPWGPLRVRRTGTRGAQPAPPAAASSHSDRPELPLPYPGNIASAADAHPPASDNRQGSWAASIRSNILHAFNAVVGASPSQVGLAGGGDTFTPAPQRHSHRGWGRASGSPPRAVPGFSRKSTSNASVAPYVWTLHDTGSEAGVAHMPAQDPFADDAQLPPASLPAPRDHTPGLLCPSQPESLTRASSMYSTASADPSVMCANDEPPQLPSIHSLSRSGTDVSHPERQHDGADVQIPPVSGRAPQVPKKTRRHRRPTLLTRQSSSQHSASSAGSAMSRTSSACSELTDGERFAKDALRARRRRVMEMSVGRVKTRRARAPTRSGKHSKA